MKSFKKFLKINEACWTGYKQIGTKEKNGHQVPNCVPEEADLDEATVHRDFTDKTTPIGNRKAYAAAKANDEKKPVSLKKAPWDMKKEEVELDEVSDKKLDAYRQKAFADQPSGDDGSDKYRKRKFGRDLAFAKQTGRAKVLATKEEVELDEISKKLAKSYLDKSAAEREANPKYATREKFRARMIGGATADAKLKGRVEEPYKFGQAPKRKMRVKVAATNEEVELDEASDLRITKVYNKFPKKATYAVHSPDRKYYKEFDSMDKAQAHHDEKTGK
jgi:hypothetical protein